ncbi:DUF2322 family protein [Gallibacterium trehalosifermentans]|uniref:DUF2322 family protein n=1 Tax=Gallibacterium trehalosifermentans TaxID=516935 RepID=A0ABV6H1P0_9PAST
MNFQQILMTLPPIDDIHQIDILNLHGEIVHTIPAIAGKLGSLRVYNALAEKFACQLNQESATQGLEWFAEHRIDASQYPGKHPNIDLLFTVIKQNQQFTLKIWHK